jgi:hypothetical protein
MKSSKILRCGTISQGTGTIFLETSHDDLIHNVNIGTIWRIKNPFDKRLFQQVSKTAYDMTNQNNRKYFYEKLNADEEISAGDQNTSQSDK